jgi:hypothetical protein
MPPLHPHDGPATRKAYSRHKDALYAQTGGEYQRFANMVARGVARREAAWFGYTADDDPDTAAPARWW